jgi:hypothetical protein
MAQTNMLTVTILVNGQPIFTRSVVNRIEEEGGYVSDDGQIIKHKPKDGAVSLAIKVLKTIKEVK